MLDKKTNAVLQVLGNFAGNGYSVLDKTQMLKAVPKKFKMDMETFCAIVMFLKENDYIDVKYQDKDSICLSMTIKAQNHFDGLKETEGTKMVGKQFGLLLGCTFLCAFVGAFLAVALYHLIF